METYIFLGIIIWMSGGALAVCLIEHSRRKYHVYNEAPFLPISEWNTLRLEDFKQATENAIKCGQIQEVTTEDIWRYLDQHRGKMEIDDVWDFEEYYIWPTLVGRGKRV